METSDRNDRRRVIEEITKRWISKHPEELKNFAKAVKEMRQGRPSENQAMTYKATIPGDLFRQLEFALSSDGSPRLFDPDGELKWFSEKYPEFIIPYDRHETVR
jgi:hypothetical protein